MNDSAFTARTNDMLFETNGFTKKRKQKHIQLPMAMCCPFTLFLKTILTIMGLLHLLHIHNATFTDNVIPFVTLHASTVPRALFHQSNFYEIEPGYQSEIYTPFLGYLAFHPVPITRFIIVLPSPIPVIGLLLFYCVLRIRSSFD